RMSLIQYAELFNAFPEVPFCVSVLSSGLNQELVSYSWIFPNVITSGHWWYSNIPAYIEADLRARLQAVTKTKQIGYYSDMYKLEFGLPKFNMYRRLLAKVLADDFVREGVLSEAGAGGAGAGGQRGAGVLQRGGVGQWGVGGRRRACQPGKRACQARAAPVSPRGARRGAWSGATARACQNANLPPYAGPE